MQASRLGQPIRKSVKMKNKLLLSLVVFSSLFSFSFDSSVFADAISPGIGGSDEIYSEEKPNRAYFGTGTAGRMTEASHLRFFGEQHLADSNYDEAIKAFSKAVQLDEGYPLGHLLLAKARTEKLKSLTKKDVRNFNQELYNDCVKEWTLILRHDADYLEQVEAKSNLRALKRIARAYQEMKEAEENAKNIAEGRKPKKKTLFAGRKIFGM